MKTLISCLIIVYIAKAKLSGLLGVATGAELLDKVEDWQISASSVKLDEPECQERFGRLYSPLKHSWCPAETLSSEWLQLDLGFMSEVSGILTQGRSGTNQYVTSYRVSYSKDAKYWQYVTDEENSQKLFPGNTDDHSLHHNYFDGPLLTRFIKIHTVSWVNYPSLRVEIVGLQGLPPFGKISSSTTGKSASSKSDCKADDAYLMSDSGWCADGKFGEEISLPTFQFPIILEDNWIQIDVGYPSTVTAIVTKGKSDFDDYWVTKYIVAYSNDSAAWNFVSTANTRKPKVFSGNFDSHSERVHFLNDPLLARYIRFYPVNWNELPGMRIGVYGCVRAEKCSAGYFQILKGSRCVENIAFSKRKYTVPSEARRMLLKQTLAHRRRRHPKKLKFRSGLIKKLLSPSVIQYLGPKMIPKLLNRPCMHLTQSRRSLNIIDLGQQKFVSGVLFNYYHRRPATDYNSLFIYIYVDNIPSEHSRHIEQLCDWHKIVGEAKPEKYTTSEKHLADKSSMHFQCRQTLRGRFLIMDIRRVQSLGESANEKQDNDSEVSFCDVKAYQ